MLWLHAIIVSNQDTGWNPLDIWGGGGGGGGGHIMAALTCATREYHLKKHRAVGVPKK